MKTSFFERHLANLVQELALDNDKMAFLSGPRQSGKTTLAKKFLTNPQRYYNWDLLDFKKSWLQNPQNIIEPVLQDKYPVIVLDEIHKNPKWKNQIKGIYDQYGQAVKIIITGSAQLNTYRKGSDSLLGRFFHFHIMPFSLGELTAQKTLSFENFIKTIQFSKLIPDENKKLTETTDRLWKLSGFPDPFLKNSKPYHQIWQKNRIELLVRQDLKDISHTLNIGQIEVLAQFIPERVGSPLSLKSLSEDLDVSYTTIARWLNELHKVYYHFEVLPHSKNVARSLKKEKKVYLYDWTTIPDDGTKFENLVAFHLKKLVYYYNDTGQADLELKYLRNKEKQEVDFIVLNHGKALFTVEVKLSDTNLDKSFLKLGKSFSVPHFQIVKSPTHFIRKLSLPDNKNVFIMSFEQFFRFTP